MAILHAIPAAVQRHEPWANGAGTTIVVLREPDDADWRLRISVATVEREGPFSEWPGVRRVLVPLDAPMVLRFADGREQRAARFGTLRFDGAPAPLGVLPEGPTRDFNLMLRGDKRADVLPRTRIDPVALPPEPGARWLVYLDRGHARIETSVGGLALDPGDAALVSPPRGRDPVRIAGDGEIVLVKLYA